MSQATIELLTSAEFVSSIVVGLIAVIVVVVWSLVARRPAPVGGLIFTAGIVVALGLEGELPLGLLLGLGLLALAGLVPSGKPILTMAAVVPGAVAVAATLLSNPRTESAGFIVAAIVPLAPLVAWFDERYASETVATPLMSISMVTVFLTVPDTEIALLAAGASLPWLGAGPPARLARLGRSGAFTLVGMLVWIVVEGGFSRSGAVVAGIATLGILVIEPLFVFVTTRGSGDAPDSATGSFGWVFLIVAQFVVVGVISVAIRL